MGLPDRVARLGTILINLVELILGNFGVSFVLVPRSFLALVEYLGLEQLHNG